MCVFCYIATSLTRLSLAICDNAQMSASLNWPRINVTFLHRGSTLLHIICRTTYIWTCTVFLPFYSLSHLCSFSTECIIYFLTAFSYKYNRYFLVLSYSLSLYVHSDFLNPYSILFPLPLLLWLILLHLFQTCKVLFYCITSGALITHWSLPRGNWFD